MYVTRVSSGSIVFELYPYVILLGGLVATMDSSIIVGDFVRRLGLSLKAFADWPEDQEAAAPPPSPPSSETTRSLREFVRPLVGKRGSQLKVRHARLEMRDGEKSVVAEYQFDETQLNRALIHMDQATEPNFHLLDAAAKDVTATRPESKTEVMLFIDTATKRPGRSHGKTSDRGVIPAASEKPLPLYFLASLAYLKKQIVTGEVNPFTTAFIVDALVQYVNGVAKAYVITNLHSMVPVEDTGT